MVYYVYMYVCMCIYIYTHQETVLKAHLHSVTWICQLLATLSLVTKNRPDLRLKQANMWCVLVLTLTLWLSLVHFCPFFSCTTPEIPSTSKHVKRRNQDHNITLRVDWKSIAMLFSLHFLILMSPCYTSLPWLPTQEYTFWKLLFEHPKKRSVGVGRWTPH